MKFVTALGATLLGLSTSVASGSPLRAEPLGFSPAPKLEKKQTCINGPTTRNCWSSGFDSSTDMYTKWPNTGRIVNYDLSITNTTCNPDGQQARVCMLINNQYPGPTLIANWGDTFRITVRNKLQHNGTSIHWHGLRQLNSNSQDGVNGVTECALAPGDAKTYTFQATEYGTTWYHSHFSAQYGDGIVGTMIINGPATANYDLDLGTYALSDWYHITAFQAARRAFENGQRLAGPPTADNILVNGTNKGTTNTTGTYNNVKLQPGKTHRLRLVNTALDVALRVSLDGHPFTVIANDFVPVVPYTTNYLLIGIGQRYDVIIRANQTAGNYWFRADPEAACRTAAGGNGRSIFTYQGQTVANPTSNALPGRPSDCNDPLPTNKIVKNVPSAPFANQAQTLPVTFGNTTVASNNQSLILWTVNGTSLIVDPAEPTLEYVAKNNNSFPRDYNVVTVNSSSAWTYWVIQQAVGAPPIPHPIHLHGHDMYILGTGTGQFNVGQHLSSLRFSNPPRRDVFHLPASGWLVIAFPTDNPGAWLMHCHIAFHVAMGLGNQFLERKSEIKIPAPNSEWWNTCTNWDNYQRNKPVYLQDDSGLKKRWPPVIE